MKRDYVGEILLKKERAKHNEREHILYYRKMALDSVVDLARSIINPQNDPLGIRAVSSDLRANGELHRYIPIGAIACVESFFRVVIKELIDIGSPFLDRASDLKEIKFDFTIVQAIQGKKLTVGDFLSHLLSVKSLDDINNVLSVLIKKDFLHELKPFFFGSDDWEKKNRFPSQDELTNENHKEIAEIYNGVKETFRLRNIFCHEAAEPDFVDISIIYSGYDYTFRFLEAANELIWNLIDPNRPISNYEWSLRTDEELQIANQELEKLVKTIVDSSEDLKQEYLAIQKAWENYKDSRLELVAKQWDGGSGKGLALLSEDLYLTEKRVAELKEELKDPRYFDSI